MEALVLEVAAFELDSNKSSSNNETLKSGYVIMMYDIMPSITSAKPEMQHTRI
jgi:hypothetical protein